MPILKSAALFCLKAAVFSAVFWVVWLNVIRPMTVTPQNNSSCSQDSSSQAQTDAYEKQVSRVNQQLDVVETQQKRTEKNISDQEQNTKRFAEILAVWEKQAGVKR
jgi:uncharacterized membrane protein YhiD involved in acid resistance